MNRPAETAITEFLWEAAIEVRAIAATAPDIVDRLQRIANELEAEVGASDHFA